MKKNSLLFLVLIFSIHALAQDFNGSIYFNYATQKDTNANVYWVKNKIIKLNQFNKKNASLIEGSFIFDLVQQDIKFTNPKRKIWGNQKSETPQIIRGTCIVEKGLGFKTIAGMRCNEYVVKNVEEDVMVTYWITNSAKYSFFVPMVKLWNRKDKQSIYFGQLKNLPDGSMPMMSEEKQLSTGKLITKLEVTKINKTMPADSCVMLPSNYTKFNQ
jgi:hypothetical protein